MLVVFLSRPGDTFRAMINQAPVDKAKMDSEVISQLLKSLLIYSVQMKAQVYDVIDKYFVIHFP